MAYLNTAFDIPLDKYSRSGLPKEHQSSLLGGIMPNLLSAAKNYPDMISQGYGEAGDIVSSYTDRATRGFKDATQGAFQGVLNNLANRGMMSSQTASDTLSQLGRGLNQQMFGDIASQSRQNLANLAVDKTKLLSQYPGLLGQLAGLGASTENEFQPYQAVLNLIQSMA